MIKNQSQVQSGKTRKAVLRRSLTISQFVVAQFFIIAAILVSKQYSMRSIRIWDSGKTPSLISGRPGMQRI
ncbi:MAG: hypothetical protein WDO16_02615 [Bacteroidota bacterium]